MLGFLLVSGMLAGVTCTSEETSLLHEEPPLERTAVPLNDSCREAVLRHVGAAVLALLRLDHPPRFTADATSRVHEAWAKEVAMLPSSLSDGQRLGDVPANQTLLTQRGRCVQASHHVTLADLGWQHWVLHPRGFVFAECLRCPCRRKEEGPPRWVQECRLGGLENQPDPDTKQRRCCRALRAPLAFVFLKEDGSLEVRPVRLASGCHCPP
uniref:Growth/differentiation factor 15-like n=1 Tax=Pogona vitticeps TaxID=103695 RepID=A0A6J0SD67_9SAUR